MWPPPPMREGCWILGLCVYLMAHLHFMSSLDSAIMYLCSFSTCTAGGEFFSNGKHLAGDKTSSGQIQFTGKVNQHPLPECLEARCRLRIT